MGLEKVESPVQNTEKEGGIVGVIAKPVDDRIVDPKSESDKEYNLSLQFKIAAFSQWWYSEIRFFLSLTAYMLLSFSELPVLSVVCLCVTCVALL